MTQGKGDEIEMISLDEILVKQKADTSKYKVAVCVTSYNQQDVIEDALNGILKQKTTFPFLIVVGDDYSTDGTRDILKRYKEQYPDTIELILQPHNLGCLKIEKKFLNYVMLLILHFAMEMIIGRMKHAFKRNMIFWKSM